VTVFHCVLNLLTFTKPNGVSNVTIISLVVYCPEIYIPCYFV